MCRTPGWGLGRLRLWTGRRCPRRRRTRRGPGQRPACPSGLSSVPLAARPCYRPPAPGPARFPSHGYLCLPGAVTWTCSLHREPLSCLPPAVQGWGWDSLERQSTGGALALSSAVAGSAREAEAWGLPAPEWGAGRGAGQDAAAGRRGRCAGCCQGWAPAPWSSQRSGPGAEAGHGHPGQRWSRGPIHLLGGHYQGVSQAQIRSLPTRSPALDTMPLTMGPLALPPWSPCRPWGLSDGSPSGREVASVPLSYPELCGVRTDGLSPGWPRTEGVE